MLSINNRKLMDLKPKGGRQGINTVLADIYGRKYSTTIDTDLMTQRYEWLIYVAWITQRKLIPRTSQVVCQQEKSNFRNSLMECARKNTNAHGLFYNNSIECQNYLEKKERCLRKGTVKDAKKMLKSLVERQQNEEVRAIYRFGPYRLSHHYIKFEVDPLKWHSMDSEAWVKHAEWFLRYRPTLDDTFDRPKSSGRKPSDRKCTGNPDFKGAFGWLDKMEKKSWKSFTFQDPITLKKILYEQFFRSVVQSLVNWC